MVLLILTTVFGFVVLYVLKFYNNVRKLPKGPFPLPLVGNVLQIDTKHLHKWILEQKAIYGPVFTIYIANPYVVLSDVKTIKEALVAHGHLCTRDTIIDGKLIPSGTSVQPFFYGANYDETVFEDPYEFKPERFLLEDGKTLNKKLYDQMYSFGKGARVCAGQSLASMELQLIFPTLVQRYEFSHPNGEVDLTCDFGGILAPNKFTCKIVKRI